MAVLAHRLLENCCKKAVSYRSLFIVSFVVFLCVYACSHTASLLCQIGTMFD